MLDARTRLALFIEKTIKTHQYILQQLKTPQVEISAL